MMRLLLLLSLLSAGLCQIQRFDGHKVVQLDIKTKEESVTLRKLIEQHHLDLWSDHPGQVHVRVSPEQLDLFAHAGLTHSAYIDDLQHLIDEEKAHLAANPWDGSMDGFFTTYRTYDEFNLFMKNLSAAYPSLVSSSITIGQTVEGRDINGIVITGTNGANSSKPAIFMNALQHAREWITGMTVSWMAYQLLDGYATNSTIKELMDHFEWIIVPVVNADGYLYTFSNDRTWRKNRRDNHFLGCKGVDTNRNWSFKWDDGGSSSDKCSETYAGKSGFSEPEDMAVGSYVQAHGNIKGYVDFHSYSQLWMNPWGYTSQLPPDNAAQIALAKQAVQALQAVHGTKYEFGNIATTIYPASGSSADFTYHVGATYSYGVELRDTGEYGFLLPASEIVPSGQETFAAMLSMGQYIMQH